MLKALMGWLERWGFFRVTYHHPPFFPIRDAAWRAFRWFGNHWRWVEPASAWCPYCRRYERAGEHWRRMARIMREQADALSALDEEFLRARRCIERLILETFPSRPAAP